LLGVASFGIAAAALGAAAPKLKLWAPAQLSSDRFESHVV